MEYTLTLNYISLQVGFMPVNIRSFNVIIVMVGLSPHRADTMYREKAVSFHVPNHENSNNPW